MMTERGGARLGAGRPKGSSNKVTHEVRELALKHGPAALRDLVKLSENAKNENVKLAALREVLDRAYGRPRQAMEIGQPDEQQLPLSRQQVVQEIMALLNLPATVDCQIASGGASNRRAASPPEL